MNDVRDPGPGYKTAHFMSARRWIRHGPTATGKIGWELEGSRWITWGYDPDPPDMDKPPYIDPREGMGTLRRAIVQQRKYLGLDPVTGQVDIPVRRRIALRRQSLLAGYRRRHPSATEREAWDWVKQYLLQHVDD